MAECLRSGGKVLTFGNGGSAADAQHLAGELVGRFLRTARPWPRVALTTDPSVITAVGNDMGFDAVFRRQVEAHGRPGDVAVGISTSGRSPNVVEALRVARERGPPHRGPDRRRGRAAGRARPLPHRRAPPRDAAHPGGPRHGRAHPLPDHRGRDPALMPRKRTAPDRRPRSTSEASAPTPWPAGKSQVTRAATSAARTRRGEPVAAFLDAPAADPGRAEPAALAADVLRARERGKPILWGLGAHVLKVGLSPRDHRPDGEGPRHRAGPQRRGHRPRLRAGGGRADLRGRGGGPGLRRLRHGPRDRRGGQPRDRGGGPRRPGPGRGPRPLPRSSGSRPTLGAACWPPPGGWGCRPPCTWRWAPTSSTCTRPATRPRWAAPPTWTSGSSPAQVAGLGGGGVYLNVGSAVLLPEVFLKAVTLARNLGHELADFATANLDFIQSYRPNTNVVQRPTAGRGPRLQPHRPPRDPGARCWPPRWSKACPPN